MDLGWFMFACNHDDYYYLNQDESVDNFFWHFMDNIDQNRLIEKIAKNG